MTPAGERAASGGLVTMREDIAVIKEQVTTLKRADDTLIAEAKETRTVAEQQRGVMIAKLDDMSNQMLLVSALRSDFLRAQDMLKIKHEAYDCKVAEFDTFKNEYQEKQRRNKWLMAKVTVVVVVGSAIAKFLIDLFVFGQSIHLR